MSSRLLMRRFSPPSNLFLPESTVPAEPMCSSVTLRILLKLYALLTSRAGHGEAPVANTCKQRGFKLRDSRSPIVGFDHHHPEACRELRWAWLSRNYGSVGCCFAFFRAFPGPATTCGSLGSPGTTGAPREGAFYLSFETFPKPAASCGWLGSPGTTGASRGGVVLAFRVFPGPATTCGWLDSPGTTGASRADVGSCLSLHPPRANRELRLARPAQNYGQVRSPRE